MARAAQIAPSNAGAAQAGSRRNAARSPIATHPAIASAGR
jgi:hypothetical protein